MHRRGRRAETRAAVHLRGDHREILRARPRAAYPEGRGCDEHADSGWLGGGGMNGAPTEEDLAEVGRIRWILHSMQRCIAAIPEDYLYELRRAFDACPEIRIIDPWPEEEQRAAIAWAVYVLTGEHIGSTFGW